MLDRKDEWAKRLLSRLESERVGELLDRRWVSGLIALPVVGKWVGELLVWKVGEWAIAR